MEPKTDVEENSAISSSQGIDEIQIMEKIDGLTNAQLRLENALDSEEGLTDSVLDSSGQISESDIEEDIKKCAESVRENPITQRTPRTTAVSSPPLSASNTQQSLSSHSESLQDTPMNPATHSDVEENSEISISGSQGIEEILEKLERLSNAQALLENALDSDGQMNEAEIAELLKNCGGSFTERPIIASTSSQLSERPNKSPIPTTSDETSSKPQEKIDDVEENSVISVTDSQGIDEILEKIDRLTNAQSRIENALDSDSQMSESDIAEVIKKCAESVKERPITLSNTNLLRKTQSSPRSIAVSSPPQRRLSASSQQSLLKSSSNQGLGAGEGRDVKLHHVENSYPTTNNKQVGDIVRERPITPNSHMRQTQRSPNTIAISSPQRRLSASSQQLQSLSQQSSSRNQGGSGEGRETQLQLEKLNLKIKKLQGEIVRQESLIDAFQEDNQKLYNERKVKETEFAKKEAEWEDLVNSLKTEIATIKLHRLVPMSGSPSRPGSGQKAELDRMKEESASKSQQIVELRKELILLRNKLVEVSKPIEAKQGKAALISQAKEKESQKTIRSLNKQVRTLQKILYTRDPLAASALIKSASRGGDDLYSSQDMLNTDGGKNEKDSHVAILESRISELESDLAKSDSEAKDRLKDFQLRLNALKGRYEEQLREYELQLDEASVKIHTLENHTAQTMIQDLQGRYDKSQVEINHLKLEISRYKRELEISQKSSVSTAVSQATVKQDAGTLSLAIKSFKSELSEKEREIIRMKKEIADLSRTNTTLKRERERYLNLTNALSVPGSASSNYRTVTRAKSDIIPKGLKSTKDKNNTNTRSPLHPNTTESVATNELLQSALEYERSEFEQIINNKKKEIDDRDKIIQRLRYELEGIKDGKGLEDDASRNHILNELRSRITAQNDLIQKLKEHIAYYRRVEAEYIRLKQDNQEARVKIEDLKKKLELARTLNNKPENEILELLGQKFDELNSRYLQREKQMDSLLNRLAVRTGSSSGSSLSPRLALMTNSSGIGNRGISSGGHLSSSGSELDLRQLSPSLSMHLLNATSDEMSLTKSTSAY